MSFSLRKKPIKQRCGTFVHRDIFGHPLFSVRVGIYGNMYQCCLKPNSYPLCGSSYYWVKWVDVENSEIFVCRSAPRGIGFPLSFHEFYDNFVKGV